MAESIADVHADDVLNRLNALLNKDKTHPRLESRLGLEDEPAVPLLTEVYTPVQPEQQLLEELLPVMMDELEKMMRQAIVELRPKTEVLLRQHLEQALARQKDASR